MYQKNYDSLLCDIKLALRLNRAIFDEDEQIVATDEELAEAILLECSVSIPSQTSEILDVVASNPSILWRSTPYPDIPLMCNLTRLLIETLEEDVISYIEEVKAGPSADYDDSPWISKTSDLEEAA